MSKMKHTPGPWRYEPHQRDEHIGTIWGADSMMVAHVYDTTRSRGGDGEMSEANAKLITAAPGLLAELDNMRADRDEWRVQHENLLAMYHAEIAKSADLRIRLRDLKRATREGDSAITAGVPDVMDGRAVLRAAGRETSGASAAQPPSDAVAPSKEK